MSVLILITGGTLDKVHDTITEGLIFCPDRSSQVPHVLSVGRSAEFDTQILMQKDSLDMTDTDRALMLKAINSAKPSRIVVTHGTGTMELTAQYLDGQTGDKTVVLTGAMRPYSLGRSDAGFNLGGAIIAAQTLDAGVYAVMNGRVFGASEVRKDTKLGHFDG